MRRRDLDLADSQLVNLLFGDHFVVELLWPRRERRARMIAAVEFKIFNVLSTNLISEPDAEASPRFDFGISAVAIWISRVFELTKLIESDAEAGPRFSFEISVVAIWISRTQLFEINFEETLKGYEIIIEEEYLRSESDAEASPRFTCGISVVAIWISRIQILL